MLSVNASVGLFKQYFLSGFKYFFKVGVTVLFLNPCLGLKTLQYVYLKYDSWFSPMNKKT